MSVDYSLLTIPIPEPFDKTQPERQRENVSYVRLQEYQLLKDQYTTEQAAIAALWTAQQAAIGTQNALLIAWKTNFPDSEEQDTIDAMIAQNTELLNLTQSPENYTFRQARLAEQFRVLETMFLKLIWQDYQYNGQEYDLDWLKVLLWGKNLFIAP